MPTSRYFLQRVLTPSEVGIDLAPANAAVDSNPIDCSGYGQATLLISFVDAGGVNTPAALTFKIQITAFDGTQCFLQAGAVDAGAATLSDLVYTKATGGASTAFVVDLPLNYAKILIKDLTVAGGAVADTTSVSIRLGTI